LYKIGTGDIHKNLLGDLSSLKIGVLKAITYVRGDKKPTMKQQFDVTHRYKVLQETG